MNKKGFTDSQIHWMFILIAGAIILAFFISIVNNLLKNNESSVVVTIVQDLQTVTTGASISKGTSQLLTKPNYDFLYACTECLCQFEINKIPVPLGETVIFAPSKIRGKDMLAWTLDWNAPFRVTNFLYLTTPRVLYVLVYEPGVDSEVLFEYVNETLPTRLNTKYISPGEVPNSISDQKYDQVRFIFLNAGSPSGTSLNDLKVKYEDITAVKIEPFDLNFDNGNLKFYKYSSNGFVVDNFTGTNINVIPYIGKEAMFGAMFSYNSEVFGCNLHKAYKNMEFIVNLYENRTAYLHDINSGIPCAIDFNVAKDKLDELKNLAKDHHAGGFDKILEPVNEYTQIRDNLSNYNYNLQMQSCTLVY
jgi:hypothetical protein